MRINDEMSKTIDGLIRKFVNHPPDAVHITQLQKAADRLNALPMAFNFDCYAIRPTGEIIVFETDKPSDFEVVNNPRIINTILFQGIKRYPELKELTPSGRTGCQLRNVG